MPLKYADQTAVLHLGHFAPKAVAGAHVRTSVTRLLVETGADPGPGLPGWSSEGVRKAAATGSARRTRQDCGPTMEKVNQSPVSRVAE
jgi:hypothetical protein